jgi:hypothetical protein
MTQSKLNEAIIKGSRVMLKDALLLKPKMNITNTEKNTFNFAIHCTLNNNPNNFDLGIFDDLIKAGAKICNTNINNSLSYVLKYAQQYILSGENIAENNIINLLKFLIANGARPSNVQNNSSNTLSSAINTENLKIIKIIIETNPKPDNETWTLSSLNTLTYAVTTNNLEIVNIAIKCDALPQNTDNSNNTLVCAIQTKNPEILREIIMVGGNPNNFEWGMFEKSTFRCFYELYCDDNESDTQANMIIYSTMIDLLMCSNAQIFDSIYRMIINKPKKTVIELKLLDCYELELYAGYNYVIKKSEKTSLDLKTLNYYESLVILAQKRNDSLYADMERKKKSLVKTLQDTMNDLILRATGEFHDRKQILRKLFISTPVQCVDMIYEYQHTIPKFNVIDWSKYS